MSIEDEYLQRISDHVEWHQDPQGESPSDPSCTLCYHPDPEEVTDSFRHFWENWAKPRCGAISYTSHTLRTFQTILDEEPLNLTEIDYLIFTLRYEFHPSAETNFVLKRADSFELYFQTIKEGTWNKLYPDSSAPVSPIPHPLKSDTTIRSPSTVSIRLNDLTELEESYWETESETTDEESKELDFSAQRSQLIIRDSDTSPILNPKKMNKSILKKDKDLDWNYNDPWTGMPYAYESTSKSKENEGEKEDPFVVYPGNKGKQRADEPIAKRNNQTSTPRTRKGADSDDEPGIRRIWRESRAEYPRSSAPPSKKKDPSVSNLQNRFPKDSWPRKDWQTINDEARNAKSTRKTNNATNKGPILMPFNVTRETPSTVRSNKHTTGRNTSTRATAGGGSSRSDRTNETMNLLDLSDREEESEEDNEENNDIPRNEDGGIDAERFAPMLMHEAYRYLTRQQESKEYRLVDFPEFRGGNQDPIEWLESFERACDTNRIANERRGVLVASYLKGTALTWFNRQAIFYWNDAANPALSFITLFKAEFCSPFKLSQWKHQLRNRKQKPGETIEEYVAAISELWKRIDPDYTRTELDRIHEFIEGLRAEFVVPVQSSMPETVNDAISKARAVETAFSIGMDLSAYSMLPGYLNNMGGMSLPAKTNLARYQSDGINAYYSQEESMERMIERKLKEGITAAIGQLQLGNNARNNGAIKCFKCNKLGHYARDCRSRIGNNNGNNQGNSNNSNIECYRCHKRGHLARNCRANISQSGGRDNRNRDERNYNPSLNWNTHL